MRARGRGWRFAYLCRKLPIVTNEDLWSTSSYPCEGAIACQLLAQWEGVGGQDLSRIDTSKPWGVESSSGVTEFVVASSQLHVI